MTGLQQVPRVPDRESAENLSNSATGRLRCRDRTFSTQLHLIQSARARWL